MSRRFLVSSSDIKSINRSERFIFTRCSKNKFQRLANETEIWFLSINWSSQWQHRFCQRQTKISHGVVEEKRKRSKRNSSGLFFFHYQINHWLKKKEMFMTTIENKHTQLLGRYEKIFYFLTNSDHDWENIVFNYSCCVKIHIKYSSFVQKPTDVDLAGLKVERERKKQKVSIKNLSSIVVENHFYPDESNNRSVSQNTKWFSSPIDIFWWWLRCLY